MTQPNLAPFVYGRCWLPAGGRRDQYRTVTAEKVRWKLHRYAYTVLVGPIPEGLDLDHLCRVKACYNPAHLEPVTRSVNLRRGVGVGGDRGNSLKTHCPRGHEYTEANTVYRPNRTGRWCRACDKEWARQRYWRKKNG